jgi:hypothetical protein
MDFWLLPGFPQTEERWLDRVLAAARISLDCGKVVERSLVAAKILFEWEKLVKRSLLHDFLKLTKGS